MYPHPQGSIDGESGNDRDVVMMWRCQTTAKQAGLYMNKVGSVSKESDRSTIKHSPYEAMFGCVPEVGLPSSPMPPEFLIVLRRKKTLQDCTANMRNQMKHLSPIIAEETTSEIREL